MCGVMRVRSFLACSGAAFAAACATYAPALVSPPAIARSYATRTLDAGPVAATLQRIAPSAAWDGKTWDRLSLMAAALNQNPALREARAHIASLDAAAEAASVGPAMTLTLTAEYAGKATESSPWLYGIGSDIPLDLGARRNSRISLAKLAALTARYDFAEATWTTRMSLRRSLAELLLTTREVAIGTKLAEVRARQLTALDRRVAGGEAVRADLERLRTDISGDARRLTDAEARMRASRAALADALGVTPSAISDVAFAWPEFETATRVSVDPATARETALLSRPDVLSATTAYDQAEEDLRLEVGRQWPDIHVGPGYTWERGLVKLPFNLILNLPPADLNAAAISAAGARRTEAGVHLEAVIARAQAAIDAALIEEGAARAALIRIREVDLAATHRIASQADQELANGSIDRVDWSAAQANALLADLNELDALRRVHGADAALEDALRRPLEGPELMITKSPGEPR